MGTRSVHSVMAAALIASAAAHSTAAEAQTANCSEPQFQMEMNICAAREFDAADVDLNRSYGRLRKLVREQDAGLPKDQRDIERQLILGQRGWIAYRDGHCAVAGAEARGGSMEPMIISSCKADLTRKRTDELNRLMTPR